MTVREWKSKSGFNETSRLYGIIIGYQSGAESFDNLLDAIDEILCIGKEEILKDVVSHLNVAETFIKCHMEYMQKRLVHVFKQKK